MQPELQLSGSSTIAPSSNATSGMTSFVQESHNNSAMMMDEEEIKELESGDDFMYISVSLKLFFVFLVYLLLVFHM